MNRERLIFATISRSGSTLSRNILSSHPDIYLTNEFRTYNFKNPNESPEHYFNRLAKNLGTYCKTPFDRHETDVFIKRCKQNLKDETLLSKIRAVEATLFDNMTDVTYIGDKTYVSELEDVFKKVPCKVIYIYRDGRDVASSGIRHYKHKQLEHDGKFVPKKSSWMQPTAEINSKMWAAGMDEWYRVREVLPKGSYLEMKYEDYLEGSEVNKNKLIEFLGVEDKFDWGLIKKSDSHSGYWKHHVPDWEQTFTLRAKYHLKNLGYI